uniref:Uncharacterized protein n=1 Tax=Anguilla anguilla TaxID=7936 RepID=A0A0E9PX05_ANGAN
MLFWTMAGQTDFIELQQQCTSHGPFCPERV